jgi:hypothetical protein
MALHGGAITKVYRAWKEVTEKRVKWNLVMRLSNFTMVGISIV